MATSKPKTPRLTKELLDRRYKQFECQMKELEEEDVCSPECLKSAMSSFIILTSDPGVKNSTFVREKKLILEEKLK